MDATKNQYQVINGVMTVSTPYGSIPAVEWTDANGNNFRAYPSNLLFYNSEEVYIVQVVKELKGVGLTDWVIYDQYQLTAGSNKFRALATGQEVGPDVALDANGNLNAGYVTNGKFFTIALGYNPSNTSPGVFQYVYSEIAKYEGLNLTN